MLEFGYYNMNCMDGMKQFPDKYFDLAIVDVPYGIGENGDKNHSRSRLALAKDYKPFAGNDLKAPDSDYFIVSETAIDIVKAGGIDER